MKSKLIALALSLVATANLAFGHAGVELGPNGGRLLEFSKDETMHGELTVKDGKFIIALLDKDKKPVAVAEQTLTANGGPTGKAEKLAVEKTATGFTVTAVKPGEWLIVQFKLKPDAKAITARMEYNTAICEECKAAEWICKCKVDEKKEEKK
jgi:uncharacterized glyoxalase superfamily protein PhnB